MGNFLNQPVVDKSAELFEFSGKTGAVVSMQGWRVQMEVGYRMVRIILFSYFKNFPRCFASSRNDKIILS